MYRVGDNGDIGDTGERDEYVDGVDTEYEDEEEYGDAG